AESTSWTNRRVADGRVAGESLARRRRAARHRHHHARRLPRPRAEKRPDGGGAHQGHRGHDHSARGRGAVGMATATEAPARAIRFPLSRLDIAGAFGDIGVLFPIAIALISLNHMNPTAVFLAACLAYILAGAYFRIPMAVQPFKAVAAIALASSLPPSSIASAGLLLGLLLAFLAATNLVTPLARLFSLPIIRGIQLGLGLILLREGIRLAVNSSALSLGRLALPSWGIALAGSVLLLAFLPSKRFPAALILLGGGVVLGAMAPHGAVFDAGVGPVS